MKIVIETFPQKVAEFFKALPDEDKGVLLSIARGIIRTGANSPDNYNIEEMTFCAVLSGCTYERMRDE